METAGPTLREPNPGRPVTRFEAAGFFICCGWMVGAGAGVGNRAGGELTGRCGAAAARCGMGKPVWPSPGFAWLTTVWSPFLSATAAAGVQINRSVKTNACVNFPRKGRAGPTNQNGWFGQGRRIPSTHWSAYFLSKRNTKFQKIRGPNIVINDRPFALRGVGFPASQRVSGTGPCKTIGNRKC